MRHALILALFVLGLTSCRPPISSTHKPSPLIFRAVVHKLDVAYAETASVTWWRDGVVVGRTTFLIPPASEQAFELGAGAPEGFGVETSFWPANSGHSWSGPEIAGCLTFHVATSGVAWRGWP